MKCTVDGCDRPAEARGLCSTCYRRRRRKGLVTPTRGPKGTLLESDVKQFQTQEDCAYAAGFFDGEGHIGIRMNGPYKSLHISIGQTSLPVLEWFQEFYGGNIYEYKNGTRGGSKPFWQWSIVGTRARIFVKQIRPFLRVKHDQADTAVRKWEERNDAA